MIALRIKEVCSEKGISQKELGEKIGLSATSLSRISSGEQNPSFDTLEKISSALGVEVWQLFTRSTSSDEFIALVKNGKEYHCALTLKELEEIVKRIKENGHE